MGFGQSAITSCFSQVKEPRCDRVYFGGVEFVKFAIVRDQDCALERLFGDRVIADDVVGKVVEDFKCEEPAWFGNEGVPVEYALVDDFDVVEVASAGGCFVESGILEFG